MSTIVLIAAVARNGVIGADGGMPWHLEGELPLFKATTFGHPIIMGRATFDSIGRALPGRRNIVLTRDSAWSAPGVEVAHGLDEALSMTPGDGPVFVIGGAQVFEAALPVADELLLSEVDLTPDGDTFFPSFDAGEWTEVAREPHAGWQRVRYVRAAEPS